MIANISIKPVAMLNSIYALFLLFTGVSNAEVQDPAQLFPGYEPTTLSSLSEAKALFDELQVDEFVHHNPLHSSSQCYQRAEIWGYDLYRNHSVNPMKAFVFFTNTYDRIYQQKYHHDGLPFWFHSAPYVLVRINAQSVTEYALDPWFTKGPTPLAQWANLFVYTKKPCAEFVPYVKFEKEITPNFPFRSYGVEHCYLTRVPGMDYSSERAVARDSGLIRDYEWNLAELNDALSNAVYSRYRKAVRSRLGLEH